MYKIFSDKSGTFKCKIDVKGETSEAPVTRLIFENADYSVIFNGIVDSNGNCEIPIKKINNILGETCSGNVKLEVILGENYFSPWSDKFSATPSKQLTVEMKSFLNQISQKPKIFITEENNSVDVEYHLSIMKESINSAGITKNMITKESLPLLAKKISEYCDKMSIDDKPNFAKKLIRSLN